MDEGSYKRKVNFKAFRVPKFAAYFHSGIPLCGCGANALAFLTGISPYKIPIHEDWKTRFMLAFLRERKFEIAKLTIKNLTCNKDTAYQLTQAHVVLAALKFKKGEASWVVLHNGIMYHNFEATEIRPYELLNHPLLEAYLVKHPSWFKI